MKEVVSVFTVTNFKTGEQFEEFINGSGQQACKNVRELKNNNGERVYPKFSKFVLEGWEIDGNFFPLIIW